MSLVGLDRETILDLVVNIIPLGIIAFFAVMFLLLDPFGGGDLYARVMTQVLHIVPFVLLAILTYISGRLIQGAEHEGTNREH